MAWKPGRSSARSAPSTGKTYDHCVADPTGAQELAETGAVEPRVLLNGWIHALAHDELCEGVDVRVEGGAGCTDDAVRWPGASLFGEAAVTSGMEITRRHDHVSMGGQVAYRGDDGVAAGHAQCSPGKEIALHIDGDQRELGGVTVHWRPLHW
jgi:hypothetical protein